PFPSSGDVDPLVIVGNPRTLYAWVYSKLSAGTSNEMSLGFTTPACESPARRRSDGRGSAEAGDAGGITPQSKRRWQGWAFRLASVPCAHRGRRGWSLR